METRIRRRYNEPILDEAKLRYGIQPDRIRLLDGFESFMYEFERDGRSFILRLSHSLRRGEELICGEVDWLNYLASGGAAVARAVESAGGRLVEHIDDGHGGRFLATAFVKAPGRHPAKADWTGDFCVRYGQILGRIHALSKRYEPARPQWRRLHWDDPLMLDVERFLPPSDTGVLARYHALTEHLGGLSRTDPESYGLIHQDAHAGNFFIADDGTITLFDFDDCVYSWYINDIAIVLFYAIMGKGDERAFTGWFLPRFLEGYLAETSIKIRSIVEIPHFLKLREIDLYAVIHRSFDVENLDDPWCKRFMTDRRRRIEEGIPYLDFDFASLADSVERSLKSRRSKGTP
jgi:Ser/Thr protein kinase RdoA (MazF antagonist)